MNIFEHISLLALNVNKSKLGGVKLFLSDLSCDEINHSTHTCGRLFARTVQRVAFVVSIVFLLVACQKATLIPDEEVEATENTRSEDGEAPADSTKVTPEFDVNGWDEAINADFTFGGEPVDNNNE